jgi:hypothetical protein
MNIGLSGAKKNKERFAAIFDSISTEIHTCAVPVLRSTLHREYSQHRGNRYETYATALQIIIFTHDHVAANCNLGTHLNNSYLIVTCSSHTQHASSPLQISTVSYCLRQWVTNPKYLVARATTDLCGGK